MPLTPSERVLRSQAAAHKSWAHTPNRNARTANARKAHLEKFDREVDPDGSLPPEERAKRAENARRAYFAQLAFKSAKARRARRNGGGV